MKCHARQHVTARAASESAFDSRTLRWLQLALVLGVVVSFALTYLLSGDFRAEVIRAVAILSQGNVDVLREYLLSFGALAPLASLAAMVLQSFALPVPVFLVVFANGLAFGVLWGWLLSLAGLALASAACFGISRGFGRAPVEALAGKAWLESADRWFARQGVWAVLLARLVPGMAFDAVSFAAGLTRMGFGRFLAATVLGSIPPTFVYAYLGRHAPQYVWALLALTVIVIGSVGLFVYLRSRKADGERTGRGNRGKSFDWEATDRLYQKKIHYRHQRKLQMNRLTDRLYKWIPVIAAVYAMACPIAAAQGGDVAMQVRMQQVVKSHAIHHKFMGTVLVAKDGHILLSRGYGMADMSWHIPNAPDVKFRIGSITKQFTAALILLLQEGGKLRIDQPVSTYLPNAPATWKNITLANLLGHTSGIPDVLSDKQFLEWSMGPHTHEEVMAFYRDFFRDEPLGFTPGSQFEYSSSNYVVLGMVIEKVSGKSYRDMLRERILKPLHMGNTGLDSNKRIVEKYARGYRPVQTKSITETYVDRYARDYRRGKEGLVRARAMSMTVPWAAGSMYSTTGDLLRWERSLFGGKVLSDASRKAMTTLGKGHYGLGVYITEKYGVKAIWHSGGFRGVNAHLMYVPAPKITVVVLSNVNGLGVNSSTTDIIANQLLKVALGKKVVLASERKAVPISEQELAKFEGTYKLPGLSLTFAADGDTLTAKSLRYVSRLLYVGVKNGHPHFYLEPLNAEIEFVPNAYGKMTAIVWHRLGHEIRGTRQPQ